MRDRSLAIIVALGSIALGLGMRFAFVDQMGFGADDLHLYESRPYGVDLPEWYENRPFLLAWTRGDGQAYVTLGADPWAQGPASEMTPAIYRYSRAGYSWMARLIVGRADLIPIGLLVVNVAALGYLGWTAGLHMRRWGAQSLALALSPGAYIAFMSDTAEALGLALATAAVLTSTPGSGLAAGFGLGLVRPDFATALFRGRNPWQLLIAVAAGAIAIRALGVVLGLDWAGTDGTVGLPFSGYFDVIPRQSPADAILTAALLLIAVITIGRGLMIKGQQRFAFLLTGTFLLLFSSKVLINPLNALRAAAALGLVWAIPAERSAIEPETPSAR